MNDGDASIKLVIGLVLSVASKKRRYYDKEANNDACSVVNDDGFFCQ
jgi:hypothetical protein